MRHLGTTILALSLLGSTMLLTLPPAPAFAQDTPPAKSADNGIAQDDENCEVDFDAIIPSAATGQQDITGFSASIGTRQVPLTPELMKTVMQVARDLDPALARKLRELQHDDPQAFAAAVRSSGRRLVGMAELRRRDPQLYGIKLQELHVERNVNRKAARLKEAINAGSGDVDRLRENLRKEVQIQLALSIKARLDYLVRLKEHVASIEESIGRDAANFPDTVESRMQKLVGPSNDAPAIAER